MLQNSPVADSGLALEFGKSKFHRDGFAIIPAFLSSDYVSPLELAATSALANISNSMARKWAPLLSYSIAQELLLSPTLVALAAKFCDGPVFGIMVDANIRRGCCEFHRDAPSPSMRGLRINIQMAQIFDEQAALEVSPGSHVDWENSTDELTRVHLDQGSAIALDLRLLHGVSWPEPQRKFVSVFYYGVPQTKDEIDAVEFCARRNLRAPFFFGRQSEVLYPQAYLHALSKSPNANWITYLQRYKMIE